MKGGRGPDHDAPRLLPPLARPSAPWPERAAAVARRFQALAVRPEAYRTAAVAAIVLGAALRVIAYAEWRPLWMDELMLALNPAARSLGGLLEPLYYNQSAPLGFLWAERLAVVLGGVSEWTLRAVPLLAGIALLPLLWSAGRRLLGEREALAATVLAALSHPLIYYSGEVKQYSSDACVTAALLHVAAGVLDAPGDARAWRRLAIAGAVATFFSMTAVFVLAAVGAALLLSPRVRAARRWFPRLAASGALWAALFLALYLVLYRGATSSSYMMRTWGETFLTPGSPDLAERLRAAARYAFVESLVPVWPVPTGRAIAAAAGAFGLGVGALWARRRYDRGAAALVTLPFAVVLAASALRQYPMATRLLVFLAPATFLVFGAALAAAADVMPRPLRGAAFATLVALVVWERQEQVRDFAVNPRRYEDTRDVVRRHARLGSPDPVYLYADAAPSWAFYATDWHAPDTARIAWMARGGRSAAPVPGAGEPVPYRSGGHEELVGAPPGMEWRERVGVLQPRPAAGWADAEARRIREAVDRDPARGRHAWVYFAHFSGVERDELLAALRCLGGHVVLADAQDTAVLYRIRFDPAVSAGCGR